MVSLHPATTEEIRDSWQFFVTGIGEVIDKCGLDFHPADVYREITAGNGPVLFWIEQDGEPVGMTVIQQYREQYSGKQLLVLDMTYLEPCTDALEELRDAVDALANELEIDRIEWYSPRVGWQRAMSKIGYTDGSVCYFREMGHG
jgi:hypothetical protein